MKRIYSLLLLLLALTMAPPAQALNINLLNLNMGSSDGQKFNNAMGSAYGFTPQQSAPAMLGPAEEVPSILKIAQAAGTVPMSVWMMRRMGMDYSSILSNFSLGPSTLTGGPSNLAYPYSPSPGYQSSWTQLMDPILVQSSRVYFLRNVLRVPDRYLGNIPYGGRDFARSLVYPYHPVHGTWMPPGIAKKYGLWIPPGQRKKMGWAQGWGKDKQGWKKNKGHYKGKGPHYDWKGNGKPSHGSKHGWKDQENWQGKGKSNKGTSPSLAVKKGNSKGGPSWKGSSQKGRSAKGGGPANGGGKGKKK